MPSPNPGAPAGVRPLPRVWQWVEDYFHHKYDMRVLENDPEALIAYNLFRHSGAAVGLPTGETIRPGDLAMELHFRREALLPLIEDGDPRRVGLALRRLGERDMPRIARALENHPELREVKALHALTLFHRGIDKMGFTIFPMEEWWAERWFSWYHRLLMARDAKHGAERVRRCRDKLVTRHVWAGREAFIRQWSPTPPAAAAEAPRPAAARSG
jgi:hypothetical protein